MIMSGPWPFESPGFRRPEAAELAIPHTGPLHQLEDQQQRRRDEAEEWEGWDGGGGVRLVPPALRPVDSSTALSTGPSTSPSAPLGPALPCCRSRSRSRAFRAAAGPGPTRTPYTAVMAASGADILN